MYAFQNTAKLSCKRRIKADTNGLKSDPSLEWKEQQKRKRKKQLSVQDAAEAEEGATYEPGVFGPDGELLQLPIAIEDMEPPAKRQRQCRTYNMPSTNERTPEGKGCPPYA